MKSVISSMMNEKDVENFYRQNINNKFGDIIFSSPFGCDGYGYSEKQNVRVLCEFKYNLDLSSKSNQIKILAQAIYYIKKFELSGKILPSTIFVGDKNSCFVIHTNIISKYLSYDLDWTMAPSNAYKNTSLINKLFEDEEINPYIFKIEKVQDYIDKIKQHTEGVERLIPITPKNISEAFRYFEEKVLDKNELPTNDLANLFTQILINTEDNYLHPVSKKKVIVTKTFGEVPIISRSAFESFFSQFEREYSPKQKEELTESFDRLIEDITRRKKGDFFTPTVWVDKAHEIVSEVFGKDWKDKYIVWNPAWGTGNLTRDYKFKELYGSTLHKSDIQTAEQMGYNKEALKFPFDFLNDTHESLPENLRVAIETGKEIIIFMNPPIGTAKNGGNKKGNNKSGLAQTMIGDLMKNEQYDKSSAQLYAQFLYRILKCFKGNFHLAFFSKPSYKTATSFKKLRKDLNSSHGFTQGFLFNAEHFDSTTDKWGLDFSIYKKNHVGTDEIKVDVLDLDDKLNVIKIGEKILYSTDDKVRACDWVRKKTPKKNNFVDYPNFSSAFKINDKSKKVDLDGYLGGYCELSNSVYQNAQGVVITSAVSILGNTVSVPIYKQNLMDIVGMFAAKKLIVQDWINDKDEYLSPNETCEMYKNYLSDSLIFSLFNNASQQTSLRQISYKDRLWNIKNEFFWMSKQEITELANNSNYLELYNDAKTDSDSYVYDILYGTERIYDNLSSEAKDVLEYANYLIRESVVTRANFANNNNHLHCWDAGYTQLKLLWKEYFPDQYRQFRLKYKILEEKLRPMVYDLGFLKK